MDVAWLILDSLSFRATAFAEDEPDTMPELAALADDAGVVFSNAYATGPLSQSSYAAMFTGRPPSPAGMHEAHPYFDTTIPTIADRIGETHRTHLVSLNAWLSQDLQSDFDTLGLQPAVSHLPNRDRPAELLPETRPQRVGRPSVVYPNLRSTTGILSARSPTT